MSAKVVSMRKTVSVANMEKRLDKLETLYALRRSKASSPDTRRDYDMMIDALRIVRSQLYKEQEGEKIDE